MSSSPNPSHISPGLRLPGRVLGIFVAKRKGEPMVRLEKARAVAGKGLEGDRYFDGTGTFSAKISAGHEVSLIEAEALEALKTDLRLELAPNLCRRNVLTRGVPLNDLVDREFSVGELILRGIELCEPCGHMEKLSGVKGARQGLVRRGGLRCQIVRGGPLKVGDAIWDAPVSLEAARSEAEALAEEKSPALMPDLAAFVPASPVEPRRLVATVAAMEFSFIPPGEFLLGSEGDDLAWDDEAPQQVHHLSYPYWLARFPVSNAQYAEFQAAQGYAQAEFWPEAIEAGVWRGGLLENKAGEAARHAPWDFGRPFTDPAHPVVGTTWYEALAFSRWLGGRLRAEGRIGPGWKVCLPSELEWEKAARGGRELPHPALVARLDHLSVAPDLQLAANPHPARRFPWGDEPDQRRANSQETGIGATSPLGDFPLGTGPYGSEELSGNVWEWTRSLWGPYPYPARPDERAQREKLCQGQRRTLKGGGFNFNQSLIRCSVRHHHSPLMRYRHIGFRVAIVPETD